MAKKAAKKVAPAAKAKKTPAKPAVAKKAAKAVKPAKPVKVGKAAPKKAVKAPSAVKEAKVEKPTVSAKPIAPVAKEKAEKIEKAPAPSKTVEKKTSEKKLAPISEKPKKEAAPKKEKKVKLDKTGLSEDQAKWHELYEKYKSLKAPAYNISAQYEAKTPIQHKIFGWGFILSNEYDRLEVVFEDGKRMLISNRKLS